MKKLIIKDGVQIVRDMTPEEEAEYNRIMPQQEKKDNETALQEFFEGLASSDTNSIAKIRELAQKLIENTHI